MKRWIYFKQAWNLIRQEPLFSLIYIVGTGLSISMAMTLAIVFHIRVANLSPETNRDRMLILKCGEVRNTAAEETGMSDGFSFQMIETCFGSLQHAEALSVMCRPPQKEQYVQAEGSLEQIPVVTKYVDHAFWAVFRFRFLDGKPFGEAEVRSGIESAVVSATLARRLFGTTEATGRTFGLDFHLYRVVGVVQDVSYALDRTFAHLWIPYTLYPQWNESFDDANVLGNLQVCALAPSRKEVAALKAEMSERMRRYGQTLGTWELQVHGQPDRQWQTYFRSWGGEEVDFPQILLRYGLVFFLLLLVPAISLSGMADSRMERRQAEMGVRRAFGAPGRTLIGQILSENFFFTFLGGLLCLLFSYGLLWVCRHWIMQIGTSNVAVPLEETEMSFSPGMLFDFSIFGLAFVFCLVLNLLSAWIPAWKAAHRPIIHSLNTK